MVVGKYCTMPVIYLAKVVEFQNENPCLYFAQFKLESWPTMFENCSNCRNKIFQFSDIFCPTKNDLSTQNVNVARFARNVE